MAEVHLSKCNHDINIALRRLKRMVDKTNLWPTYREQQFYTPKSAKNRAEKIAAQRREMKKKFKQQMIQRAMRRSGKY